MLVELHVCVYVCDLMSMCCTRVPWIMASKHYYRHASLSGICSIEILGDGFNLTDVGGIVLSDRPLHYLQGFVM